MQIIPLRPNDLIQLKKPHPCGGTFFEVLRVGSDVRIKCKTCGRDMTLDRLKLEKSIRRTMTAEQNEKKEKGNI